MDVAAAQPRTRHMSSRLQRRQQLFQPSLVQRECVNVERYDVLRAAQQDTDVEREVMAHVDRQLHRGNA